MKGSRAHLIATLVWVVALVPTLTVWKDSILWVLIMSLWANVVSHATGYDAAKAKELQQGTPSHCCGCACAPAPTPNDS